MNAKEAIKQTYGFSRMVLSGYIRDLSDEDLMQRPGDGCNNLAWQLGHLISSECSLLNSAVPDAAPELPDGFADQHGKENTSSDDASQFCTKAQYAELFDQVQAATFAALDGMSDEDLDKPIVM